MVQSRERFNALSDERHAEVNEFISCIIAGQLTRSSSASEASGSSSSSPPR